MAQAHNGLWCRRANVHAIHNTRINFHGVFVDGYLWGGKIVEMKYEIIKGLKIERQRMKEPLPELPLIDMVSGDAIMIEENVKIPYTGIYQKWKDRLRRICERDNLSLDKFKIRKSGKNLYVTHK